MSTRATLSLAVVALAVAAGCTSTPTRTVTAAQPVVVTPAPAPPVVITPAPAPVAVAVSPASDTELMMHAAQDSLAEVRIAQLAQQRASSDVVRQLAQRLITDHNQANSELFLLVQQRGLSAPMTLDAQHQAVEQRLSMLSGPQFDIAFLEHMIGDHAKGIAMFERAAATAADPVLRSWAARQLPVLRQHQAFTQSLHAQLARTGQPSASPVILPR